MKKELSPRLLWLSLTLNVWFGGLLDRIIGTSLYGEAARHSVSGVTGYLAYYKDNKRALMFAIFINLITGDKEHCRAAAIRYIRQTAS